MYVATGARHHRRLPPPVHAPRVQDDEGRARRRSRSSARWRSRARSSPGSPTTASTTPSPTSRATRTVAARRPRPRLQGRAARAAARARRLAVHPHPARPHERYAPDLMADPVDPLGRTRRSSCGRSAGWRWPFVLGWLIGGTCRTALTGLLWGGAVRMLVLHHVTYSINSLCHFFGRRDVRDRRTSRATSRGSRSRRSASRGTTTTTPSRPRPSTGCAAGRSTLSALVIRPLEKLGLAWDVVRISPEKQAKRAAA